MIKILFVASNPVGTTPLQLDEEIRSIEQRLGSAVNSSEVKLQSLWAVRPDDLLDALMKRQPNIVHFSGHGNADGQIILNENENGLIEISEEALKMLFDTAKDSIKLVFLNCCYSEKQAKAIAEVIDCVVGMSKEVADDAAIKFAASFYSAICSGRSVQQAFDHGKTAIRLNGIADSEIPRLGARIGVDPSLVFFTGDSAIPSPLEVAKNAPQSIVALLKSGSEFIDVATMLNQTGGVNFDKGSIFCELRMTSSDGSFIFRVTKQTLVGDAANCIGKYVMPGLGNYEWQLVHNNKSVLGYMSFMAAGIRSGDYVNIIGHNKMPEYLLPE